MKHRTVCTLGALAALLAACAHQTVAPSHWQWGMPVYPRAVVQGRTNSHASFVLYRTADSLDEVYAWYLAEVPEGTPHALSEAKKQATFALFDARAQRTIHIESEGQSTAILLTNLTR